MTNLPKNWTFFHRNSNRLVFEAENQANVLSLEQILKIYQTAAEQEQLAFNLILSQQIKTRSIIYVSSATLFYKAREFEKTQQLIATGLLDPLLLPFAKERLIEVRQELLAQDF